MLFDWGGTLMSEEPPDDATRELSMGLWSEVRAIEGAHETLAALAPNHRIGLATNATVSGRDMIERALSRVGLREYISEIFCFTDLGMRKESAAFWSHVLSSLNVSAADIAMVGDTLEPDVIAPRRYGVYSVWFNENARQPAADYPTIHRLADLRGVLAKS